jgi:hypothetical protein
MYGGLTGFGMHPSLGGLLIGGARTKIADMTNAELTAYKLAKGQKKALAKKHLKEHIDAERWAAQAAMDAGHPDYDEWLTRDYNQEQKIYEQKRLPTWAANEYSYNTLYQPKVKKVLTDAEYEAKKLRAKNMAKHKKYMRMVKNVPKIVNPKTGKEVYIDTPTGKRILKAAQTLGEFGRQSVASIRGSRSGLYSNIEEARANRSGLSLGPEARSIAAASRSGRNPLGISDAALIAALESGQY